MEFFIAFILIAIAIAEHICTKLDEQKKEWAEAEYRHKKIYGEEA